MVDTITMPRDKAKEQFDIYTRHLRERQDEELEAVRRGYRELAKGNPIIDVHKAISDAGLDERGRPRLAIVRAHAKTVFARVSGRNVTYSEEEWPRSNARFSVRSFSNVFDDVSAWARCQAVVPMVPPQYRPRGGLHNYYLLWEAEWVSVPEDPYLLRHLGGHLYAVMAQWDLTPLEMAVLKGRVQ